MKKANSPVSPSEINDFLSLYSSIRRIAACRLGFQYPGAVEDIAQRVMLKLWQWRTFPPPVDKDFSESQIMPRPGLSAEEWQRLANTATNNEVKSFYAAKHRKEIPLPETSHLDHLMKAGGRRAVMRVEGNTVYELGSQLRQIWKFFLNLTLRERYAFILKERGFCNRLLFYRCCGIGEIAAAIQVSRAEFIEIYQRLPLENKEIAELLAKKVKEEIPSTGVIKARQRAKAKLHYALIKDDPDGKTFNAGKT